MRSTQRFAALRGYLKVSVGRLDRAEDRPDATSGAGPNRLTCRHAGRSQKRPPQAEHAQRAEPSHAAAAAPGQDVTDT
jgi:hypothetical protein